MATEILKVVPIGNSKGIRIPGPILRRYSIGTELEMVEQPDGLFLRPINSEKLSLEESFRQMAADPAAIKEARVWEETLADGLDPKETW